ncbi:MAG: MFS transporter [Mycobacterium sp.]
MARRRPALILAICCMSLFIVNMDATIVNVALPSIGADLDAPISGLQWTIDAYVVVLACFLLLAGSTADRIGRRRTFQMGLVLFVAGSVLCSLAPTLGWLVTARVVQALGGSMLNPVAMSIITTVYTAPAAKARAIGVWGAVAGLGMALGPLVGGALIELVGWRAIFWVNLPIGLITLVATAVFIPESRSEHPRRFDPVGQVAMLAMLGSATFAIIEAPRKGWVSGPTLGCLALTLVAAVVLVSYEPRRVDPLIELRFFASAPFCGAVLVAICAFGASSGVLFLNTLYLQAVRGLSPLQAGLYTLPLAMMMAIVSPLSGRLVGRYGPRPSLVCAGIMVGSAGFGLWWLDADTPLVWVLVCLAAFGIGHGAVNAPITYTTVSGMPRSHAGVAAAVATTSRQIGTALGVAIVGSVLNSRMVGPLPVAFVAASRPALLLVSGLGLAVLVIGLATTGDWAEKTTRRVTHLFGDEVPDAPASLRV